MIKNPFSRQSQQDYFLLDCFIEDFKKMTSNTTINVGLLTIGTFFMGLVPTLYQTSFWYSVISALVGVGVIIIYELLP